MTQAEAVTLVAAADKEGPVIVAHAGAAADGVLEGLDALIRSAAAAAELPAKGVSFTSAAQRLVGHVVPRDDSIQALVVRAAESPPSQVAAILEVLSAFAGPKPLADAGMPRRDRRKTDLTFPPGSVRCSSPAMRAVYQQLSVVAASDLPILICGETGVGKDHIARLIHLSSPRRDNPFVPINCTAIPGELLEAELFGIESGVATGVSGRSGTLVQAGGGTVFLDEIADMTPSLQAKLLRVLEAGEVFPVGARRPLPLDVRIISATNADLAVRRAEGRFRPDLYHRLAGLAITVPPLRERREDIPELVQSFIQTCARKYDVAVQGVTQGALSLLMVQPWEGNVRQLEKSVELLVLGCPQNQPVTLELVRAALGSPAGPDAPQAIDDGQELTLASHVRSAEKRVIAAALARTNGRIAPAARLLGISRQTLRSKRRSRRARLTSPRVHRPGTRGPGGAGRKPWSIADHIWSAECQ